MSFGRIKDVIAALTEVRAAEEASRASSYTLHYEPKITVEVRK